MEAQLVNIKHYIRNFNGSSYRGDGFYIIVHKDWLWSAEGNPGIIKQYNYEGKCIGALKGHKSIVGVLFGWRDCIYSGSFDYTIRVWSIITGQCVRELIGHTNAISTLTEWRGSLISVCSGGRILVWNDDGECVHRWDTNSWISTLTVWNNFLCSGYENAIKLWSDYGTCVQTLKG